MEGTTAENHNTHWATTTSQGASQTHSHVTTPSGTLRQCIKAMPHRFQFCGALNAAKLPPSHSLTLYQPHNQSCASLSTSLTCWAQHTTPHHQHSSAGLGGSYHSDRKAILTLNLTLHLPQHLSLQTVLLLPALQPQPDCRQCRRGLGRQGNSSVSSEAIQAAWWHHKGPAYICTGPKQQQQDSSAALLWGWTPGTRS